MYENGQGCGLVCADGKESFRLPYPPVWITHIPAGMVSLKVVVLGMVRALLLVLYACRLKGSKCLVKFRAWVCTAMPRGWGVELAALSVWSLPFTGE